MGKVKRKARLHTAAPKSGTEKNKQEDTDQNGQNPVGMNMADVGAGVFSKLDIDANALQQRLPSDWMDSDVRSSVSNKSLKGLNLSKKDRRKLRHHVWLKKVDTLKEAKREAADTKKRQKTVVVGDMKPLEDTLPTLELLLKDMADQSQEPEPTKPKPVKKEKARQKQMVDDYSTFEKVLNHPTYRENPLATIREHLQIRMEMDS